MYSLYQKPYRNPTDLIDKLKSQNLIISDEAKAKKILSKINYFRFKIYLRPFLDISTKEFKVGSSFEDAYVAAYTNNPFWYLDEQYFSNKSKIFNAKISLKNEFLRSKDDFTIHYKKNYINNTCNDFKEMPPFWIILELFTFGNILVILETINKKPFALEYNQNILDNLAQEFGAKNLRELNSWLKLIRDVRNRVAHHNRVWNCNYREPYGIRQNLTPNLQPTQPNKIYLFFVVLEKLFQKEIIDRDIRQEMKTLVSKYEVTQKFLNSMGVPRGWLEW